MAKKHSSLTGADLHAPQGFSNENATEIWHVTQSANKVNLSGSFLPTEEAAFDLGSAALSFKDGYFDGSLLCTQNFRRTVTTASESSGTHTCTLVDNDNFNIAVTNAATTIALVVATENIGQSGMITITNPASVGSLSFVALPSYMLTPDGATVNFVTTANAVSIISYYVHATDKVLVNYVGKFE